MAAGRDSGRAAGTAARRARARAGISPCPVESAKVRPTLQTGEEQGMARAVDVAIIGAGTAGLNAMAQVRRAGRTFVLINGGALGTTCARVGCMPSKAFIQVAEDFHRRHIFERHCIEGGEGLSVDTAAALEHVRDLRDLFVDRVLQGSTDEMGDELIEGYARFVSPTELEVDGERIRARRIVIATGSRPVVPEAWQALGERVLTTDQFFEQEDLPPRMAVIGLGVIGLELGQALARLGVAVTGIDAAEAVSGLSDPQVNAEAVRIIGAEFPLWLGQPAELSLADDGVRVQAGERSVVVDRVLVSMGRRPNLEGLGLEQIGIPLDERGMPPHDPHTMQIQDLPIFLAGDVSGERPILHEAGDEGKIAGYNASHDTVRAFRRKTPLAITFCDPNIVQVGQGWAELAERPDVAVGEMRLGPVGRALIMGKNKGIIRVYAERASGRLLGAALCSVRGENLGHLLAWAIEQGLTVWDALRMPFYHPVIEEALQAALYQLAGACEGRPEPPIELRPLPRAGAPTG